MEWACCQNSCPRVGKAESDRGPAAKPASVVVQFCESHDVGQHRLDVGVTPAHVDEQRAWEDTSRELLDGGCLLCSEEKPHHYYRRLVAEYLKQHWGDVRRGI